MYTMYIYSFIEDDSRARLSGMCANYIDVFASRMRVRNFVSFARCTYIYCIYKTSPTKNTIIYVYICVYTVVFAIITLLDMSFVRNPQRYSAKYKTARVDEVEQLYVRHLNITQVRMST